ncbi:FAD-dependent monooxygenase [Flagellimonas marinaquae]|uniref:FAD-dependent monooxygenase n=1 Tax=Flagellimonas marinaquae TaxID=254955 RepID=UPI000F8F82B2|nr:FAD-dependent monooxygenase [Allomuricauda aquimarina]
MRITIIGGGITGLTTALALKKVGFQCEVFEKAREINEVGAGIWVQPNALKILDWLNLGQLIRDKGTILNQVDITNPQLVPFKKTTKEAVQDDHGNKIVAILRADLQKILFDALPEQLVHLGQDFKSYQYESNEINVLIGNKQVSCDLLIGADGIHSKVRTETFENTVKRFSGQTCWRGVADFNLPSEFESSGIEVWGRKIRFGFSQIGRNKVYWFAVINAKQGEIDELGSIKPKLSILYKDFHEVIHKILDHTAEEKIIRSDISDLKRLKSWHKENVLLLGDAAHATTPNMGQGACQGIEDAYYLANTLKKHNGNLRVALNEFESSRREKVEYVVSNSWRFGKMAHSLVGQFILKSIIRLTPEHKINEQMKKLYHVKEFS